MTLRVWVTIAALVWLLNGVYLLGMGFGVVPYVAMAVAAFLGLWAYKETA